MPGKAQPRGVDSAMDEELGIGALSRKRHGCCGTLDAQGGHMGAMFWFGLMLAVLALAWLVVKSRRQGSGRGDGGFGGDGGRHCDADAGGCDGGDGGGGGD